MRDALPGEIVVRLTHPTARLTAVTVSRPGERELAALGRLGGRARKRALRGLAIVTGLTPAELRTLAEPDIERVAQALASFAPAPGAR